VRVGVIGAGAVGGSLAALLARAGHEVTVTARGAATAAIEADGIVLSGAWGDFVARVTAVPQLAAPVDLALVATKAADAAAAIAASAEALAGIPVVVVQNGLNGPETAAALLPRSRVLGGLALFAATLLAPGQVRVGTPGPLYVGPTKKDDEIVRLLAEAVPTVAAPDFVGMQWSKLVVNMVNALPAVTGLSVQQVVADPRLRRVLTRSIQETVRVGRAAGVHFGRMNGLSDPLLRLVADLPGPLADTLPLLMARRMGAVPNPGSTLQSIRRGQPTEIDALNGAVVRRASELGLDASVNDTLVTLVHEVERTGRFLEAGAVVRRALH
jgi:2-dehydropantoate 2-reductase